MRFLSASLAALAILTGACATISPASEEKSTKAYVIRHLQKGPGDDPSLTAEGAAGAACLAEQLKDKGIAAVFATPTRRAMETARPLAQAQGLAVTPYDPRDPSALVEEAATAAGSVLVVGHSNTVPDLVERFGGTRPPPLGDLDYGRLFAVDRSTRQVTSVDLGLSC